MKVVMLPDWHGVAGSISIQTNYLQRISPQGTVVFHEPIPGDLDYLTSLFNAGAENPNDFYEKLKLSEHWGPSEPYKQLYEFLGKNGYIIAPLDHSLDERLDLSKTFRQLVNAPRQDGHHDMQDIKKFDKLKRYISFDRESIFCQRVDDVKYGKNRADTAVVIMHPSHMIRCASYFKDTQGYETIVPVDDSQLAERLSGKEGLMQTEYALTQDVGKMENPPLVPIVFLAWSMINTNI